MLDVEGHRGERVGNALAGGGQVRRVFKRGGNDGSGLDGNGKLVPKPGVICGGKKRHQGRHIGDGGKTEIALAMLGGGFEFFHDPRGRAHGAPAHAVFAGHHQAAVQVFRIGQDFCEQVGLGRRVGGVQHGRADGHRELLLLRESVQQFEESHRLFRVQALDVFGERLRGDADGLDLIAARFKDGLRPM